MEIAEQVVKMKGVANGFNANGTSKIMAESMRRMTV